MKNLVLIQPFENEGDTTVKVILEPLSEYFLISPGEKIEVYGICHDSAVHRTFFIGWERDTIIFYAPGTLDEFVDCYVIKNGTRLTPDGN